MNLFEVAKEITRRLAAIFLRDASGKRPVYGGTAKFQEDPHWRDLILFYEYFHGDNGAGLGASHQTGWTGIIAPLLDLFGRVERGGHPEDGEGRPRGAPRPGAGAGRVGGTRWPARATRRSSRSTRGSACRSSPRRSDGRRRSTTSPTPSSTASRRTASTSSGSSASGRPGEAARRVSASNEGWRAEYHRVLPDFRESDVCGSCFAIRDYRVHADFGGDAALARLRGRLRERGPPAHPRLRPEPHGAGPPVGDRPPGLVRGGQRGAARPRSRRTTPGSRRARGSASSPTAATRTSTAGPTRSS